MNRLTIYCVGMLVLMSSSAACEEPDDLDSQLLRQADTVLSACKQAGFENIGVLRFDARRVVSGNLESPESTEELAGPFGLTIATRLEFALIIRNDISNPIGIIKDASSIAARQANETHLTRKGRLALLSGNYPLAWGDAEVKPDAFISGEVLFDKSLQKMRVRVQTFYGDAEELESISEFVAVPTPQELIDAAASFRTRGAFDGGDSRLTAVKSAGATAAGLVHPLKDPSAPVQISILRNGREEPLEFVNGGARIREPQVGDKISIQVSRRSGNSVRCAFVLKVNGENSLYRQRGSDLDCSAWVLESDRRTIEISGYQTGPETREDFRVLSRSESRRRSFSYGDDVGRISIAVFREREDDQQLAARNIRGDGYDRDFGLLAGAEYPTQQPADIASLKFQFRTKKTRGLIDSGPAAENLTRTVKFERDPLPIMAATITYYTP